MWLDRTFTEKDLKRFYRDYYRPLVNQWHGKPSGYDWRPESRAHYARVFDIIGVPQGRVLDVGGLEPLGSEWWVLNPETEDGTLETCHPSEPFDVIICAQTLDHLADPVLAFHRFAQWLQPGGKLWVDYVRRPHQYKIDHPTNWTWNTLVPLAERWFDIEKSQTLDKSHIGLWLVRA